MPVKTHFRVSVEEHVRRDAETFLQAEEVVGHQDEIQAGAAAREALNVPVAEECEPVSPQGFKDILM